jgi:hypothetical protein
MSPESDELVEAIEVERVRIAELLNVIEKSLREREVVDEAELDASDAEAAKAIDTLRRAGLLPAA